MLDWVSQKDEVILIEEDLIGLHPTERARGRENFDFHCFMVRILERREVPC